MSLSQTRVNPSQDPNYTGASRGPLDISPNRSTGIALQGLANVVQTGTQAVDETIKRNIQQDIWGGYDQEIGAQGNDAYVEYQAGRDGTPLNSAHLPSTITGKGQTLAKLQQARDEGRISDAYYFGRLDSMTRELRAKYPGYREDIDNMVSSITGVQPANALRRSILAEMELADNQKDSWEKFVMSNLQYAGPWAEQIGRGELPTREVFLPYVAQQKSLEADIELKKQMANVADLDNRRNVENAKRGLSDHVDYNFNKVIEPLTSKIRALTARGLDATPEEKIEAARLVNQLINVELEEIWHSTVNTAVGDSGRTWRSIINDETELAKLKEAAFARPRALAQALTDNKTGILQFDTTWVELMKSADIAEYLNRFPIFRDVIVMREFMGNDLVNSFMLLPQGSSMLNQLGKVAGAMTAYRLTEKDHDLETLLKETEDLNLTPEEKKQHAAGVMKAAEFVLLNPNVDDDRLAKAVQNIFGPRGSAVFSDLVEKGAAFRMLADPRIAARIGRLDPTSQQTYRSTIQDWFMAVNNKNIADLKDVVESNSGVIQLVRDADGLFRYEMTEAGRNLSPDSGNGRQVRHMAANGDMTTNEINGFLSLVTTALKAAGGNTDTLNRNLDRLLGMGEFKREDPAKPETNQDTSETEDLPLRSVGEAVDEVVETIKAIPDKLMEVPVAAGRAVAGAVDALIPDSSAGLTPEGQAAAQERRQQRQLEAQEQERQTILAETQKDIERLDDLFRRGEMKQEVYDRARQRLDERLEKYGEPNPAEGGEYMSFKPETTIDPDGTISITPYSPSEVELGAGYTDKERDEEAPEVKEFEEIAARLNAYFNNLDKGGSTPEIRRAKPILDLIGRAEAPKGYNQIFGRNRSAPLDQMTVAQVLQLQRMMVSNGSPSSAVGRYQFINKTLRGLVTSLRIDPNTKFTPELQDRLAMALLEGRGLSKFLDGSMSARRFQQNLSMEWAGLPSLNGRSYYARDGLNKATVGTASLVRALEQLRS
jgi:muramidase (phage lysozyme)